MKMAAFAEDVKTWTEAKKIRLSQYVVDDDLRPDTYDLSRLKEYHPDLPGLYDDNNGILVAWNTIKDKPGGCLLVEPADELISIIKSERSNMKSYSDDEILQHCHDRKWWLENLALYRSLVPFYKEGTGDCICVSGLDNAIYFVAHDWMDWVSNKPPIFQLANSLHSFFLDWSEIHFGYPKSSYWPSTVANGTFKGFNSDNFITQ